MGGILFCVATDHDDRPELDRLLLAVQAGRTTAWDPLLERLQRRMFVYAFRIVGCGQAAADVTQEALQLVPRRLHQLASNELLVPWALAIVRHFAWKHLARDGRRRRRELPIEDAPEPATAETPLDRALQAEEIGQLRAALRRLDAEDREVLHLHYFEGLSVARIAAVTDQPQGTVKWRMHRARRRLNDEFHKECENQ